MLTGVTVGAASVGQVSENADVLEMMIANAIEFFMDNPRSRVELIHVYKSVSASSSKPYSSCVWRGANGPLH